MVVVRKTVTEETCGGGIEDRVRGYKSIDPSRGNIKHTPPIGYPVRLLGSRESDVGGRRRKRNVILNSLLPTSTSVSYVNLSVSQTPHPPLFSFCYFGSGQ